MTEADLGVKSMPRNPLLFGMLYRMGVVENIGSGIKRIHELCREHGVAKPTIDASEHWVTVTFPRPAGQVETEQIADGRCRYGPKSDLERNRRQVGSRGTVRGRVKARVRVDGHPAGIQSGPKSEAKVRGQSQGQSQGQSRWICASWCYWSRDRFRGLR